MLGLKKGTVRLCPHDVAWERAAARSIAQLSEILGDAALAIEHVGSTSIPTIEAKPILDIAVAVERLSDLLPFVDAMRAVGYHLRAREERQLLFAAGPYYEGSGEEQTHFIHVVPAGSREWTDYLNFRNYLRSHPDAARSYERVKRSLAKTCVGEGARERYTSGKAECIAFLLRKALVDSYLGVSVTVGIDRPIGYVHKKKDRVLVYPINYGYIPGVLGGDGEELDVYLLGVDTPVTEYTARVIAVVHRENDVEDKLVAAPEGKTYTAAEIADAIRFQEKYYRTHVETLDGGVAWIE